MRPRAAKIAIGVDRPQTYVRGASREVHPQAAPDRVGVAPKNHRTDKQATAAIGEFGFRDGCAL